MLSFVFNIIFLLSLPPQLQMTYGLNFPSVPLPYFYQANKMLNSGHPQQQQQQHSNAPSLRDEDLDNNCSDEQSRAMSSPPEKPQQPQTRRDSDKRTSRPHEEDVEVD